MKKSIFEKKMKNKKFKAIYDEVAIDMSIGEQIAKLRHKAKMSQLDLARKVYTNRTAIARYENRSYNRYNLRTLMRIGKALHKKLKISYV
ncbi:MAG: helix-turn-helix transcriptional regulator [Candidatus Omnitrophota bacterium]|jgi:DNA-binding XRE family transcriptional regulator